MYLKLQKYYDHNLKYKVITIKDKFKLVGTKIPEFELPNSRGNNHNIRDFENDKNVIVVLFRDIN